MKKLILILLILPLYSLSQTITPAQLKSEALVLEYFSSNPPDEVEGIYKYKGDKRNDYRLTIVKSKEKYHGYILTFATKLKEMEHNWPPGKLKFTLEKTAADNVFAMKWIMGNGSTRIKSIAFYEEGTFQFSLDNGSEDFLYKSYP